MSEIKHCKFMQRKRPLRTAILKRSNGKYYNIIINNFKMIVKKGTENIMLSKVIAEINKQGEKYKKHSNEWNVMQQLIDIVSFQPDCAEIVLQDLGIEEMSLDKLVKKITGKRMQDPYEIVKEICKFYAIECPKELPPEAWRSQTTTSAPSSEPISLLDLM